MDHVNLLRGYGLFDAKVPRYTSYPPANRFMSGVGARNQKAWLERISDDAPVSLYVHIPFCRRLCWFCACRTQGTQTLAPVASYIETLLKEFEQISNILPPKISMARLHLGGGTPTLLDAALMNRLLKTVFDRFALARDFEFSVEIDPTEAKPEVLETLAAFHMTRASVGVQDFDPRVQKAIGRMQSFDVTHEVIAQLRDNGVTGLNVDFLYGLPYQTNDSLCTTLDQVLSLKPDRLALYGYAHVPHMSKRQVMIPDTALPGSEDRFVMADMARRRLIGSDFVALGLDHFARPHDSLTKAALNGAMKRNFQGYTDDPCETLLGFGASAISKMPQGYFQNAVATSAYAERIERGGLAAHKGFVFDADSRFVATMIETMMCDGVFDSQQLENMFPQCARKIAAVRIDLLAQFGELFEDQNQRLKLRQEFFAAARLIAARMDGAQGTNQIHSLAV